ncbi:hypothetical protein X781_20610 [Mannheimia sp. USDA-ARS-USMARC-1261]|nr:hypothetical protein X781_20610 [Mannheimia sp. USDA-ARS-USMARC-1261]
MQIFRKKQPLGIKKERQPVLKRFKSALKNFKKERMINHTT